MVLVQDKLLEYLQTKRDAAWKRPTEESVKTSISNEMKSTLDDPAVPEDVRAKLYGQNLSRFLRTKRKLPSIAPTVDERLDVPVHKKKRKKKRVIDTKAKRTPKRVPKKPQRYADIEWENW